LTAGRAAAVKRLEERYSDERLSEAASNPMNKRLAALAARVDAGTWDAGFVESVTSQVSRGSQLSEKQVTIVSKIEARWSDESRSAKDQWKETYRSSSELKERAHIAATYYQACGYYRDLAWNIVNTEGFIPTEKQYNSITDNKYARKILDAWYSDPKFAVGSYVTARDTAPGSVRGKAKQPCVVLKTNAQYPTTSARGSKIYQILPFGSSTSVFTEERYLKPARIGGKK